MASTYGTAQRYQEIRYQRVHKNGGKVALWKVEEITRYMIEQQFVRYRDEYIFMMS
jgi:hypothetical protein